MHQAAEDSKRWWALGLIFVAVLINYVDRGILSVVAVALMEDLSISPAQMGTLLSAFFWTYTLMQVPGGYLVDRFGIKWIFACGFALWSIASALVGWAGSFAEIFALRLLLGIGEATAPLVSVTFIRRNFSEAERGLPTGIYLSGLMVGPALSLAAGGYAMEWMGWRNLFLLTGFGALLWLIPWVILGPSGRTRGQRETAGHEPGVGVAALLRSPLVWSVLSGTFFYAYLWYFIITWLPSYLVMERGFAYGEMGALTGQAMFGMAILSPLSGRWADHRIARQGNALAVRRGLFFGGMMLASVMMLLPSAGSRPAILAVLLLSFGGIGIAAPNFWALLHTMTPSPFIGRAMGVQNAISSLSGVCAPILTGYMVGESKNFQQAIVFAGATPVVAGLIYLTFIKEKHVEEFRRILGEADA